MKILLINPIITMEREELIVPLNLVYLSSAINEVPSLSAVPLDLSYECLRRKKSGWESLMGLQKHAVDRAWSEHGPFDLVGLSGLCDNFPFTIRLSECIKKRFEVPIVFGGPHVSFCSKALLRKFPFVDYVVRFDGVLPLRRLCVALKANQPLTDVPSLSFRSQRGEIVENPGSGDSEDGVLGIVPDYATLPINDYLSLNPQLRFPVLAGTGCP